MATHAPTLAPAEHAALSAGLGRGDPLADAAARESLVGVSLAAPPVGSALARLIDSIDLRPPWLDLDALARGGELVHRAGPLAIVALSSSSLVQGYADPRGNKPLVMSGQLERRAYRRLHETARFLLSVCAEDGMRGPHGPGWQTAVRVRLIHGRVRNLIRASGRWCEDWGEPANQHDTVGTLTMFTVVLLEGLERLGMRLVPDEAERYYQLFRYVGHVLGIEDALLPVDLAHARRTAASIRAEQPPPDDDSRALTRALIDAPIREARSPLERALGTALRQIMLGGSRSLLPPMLADALAIPRSPARHLVRAAWPLSAAWGALGRSGLGRQATVRLGRSLWHAFVGYGLANEPASFAPPERLDGRSR